MTDEQAHVINHILATTPQLIQDETEYGGESIYALQLLTTGESLLAAFTRWGGQSLVQTSQDENGQMRVHRIKLNNSGIKEMDALCAAWIEYRSRHLLPEEPTQSDGELGDVDIHPF